MPVNPALLRHAEERRQSLENRIADAITRFAGSMRFVYLHIIWFAAWIGFRVEHYPFGLLTMIVSLRSVRTRSCCGSPTRSWSSPRPSTR